MGETFAKFIALLLSILFYLLLTLFFIFYILHEDRFHKVEVQAQAIDVIVLEEKPKRHQPKPLPQKKVPRTTKSPKKSPGSSTPKKIASIEDLFAGVKVSQRKKIVRKRSEPSRFKGREGKKAKELLKQLKIEEYTLASKRSIKSVSGEKDPYLEKIYKILYSYWLPSQQSAGSEALVRIHIDRYGNFSYTIERSSSNPIFNEELRRFLEEMRHHTFPAPKSAKEIVVRFEAKD